MTKMMAHLPLATLDHAPVRGLVVCFGMGTTYRSMMSWGIATTAVELVPSVPEVFGVWGPAATPEEQLALTLDSLIAPGGGAGGVVGAGASARGRAMDDDRPVNEYFLLRRLRRRIARR